MADISEKSLDDLLRKVFSRLLKSKSRVKPTKGENGELFGVLLELKKPRARLSRAETRGVIYSCIGEFLWYMSKSSSLEFIQSYIGRYSEFAEEDGTVNGAYGPRLFDKDGINQVDFVIQKLRENPHTRKAVIQLYDAKDSQGDFKDVPCTCSLQFVLRDGLLHMQAHMRSNDAYLGLPHDIFCFTMIQELIAGSLGAKLGTYKHSVGSLHLYTDNDAAAQEFIDEAFQDIIEMPSMPAGDQWCQLRLLLEIEPRIRNGETVDTTFPMLNNYWADIARLIAIKFSNNARTIVAIKDQMVSSVYETYIRRKHERLQLPAQTPELFSELEGEARGS